jgi:hypothetical protein
MSPITFFDLPNELRNYIYELLMPLTSPNGTVYWDASSNKPAILSVSRRFRTEALPIWRGRGTFLAVTKSVWEASKPGPFRQPVFTDGSEFIQSFVWLDYLRIPATLVPANVKVVREGFVEFEIKVGAGGIRINIQLPGDGGESIRELWMVDAIRAEVELHLLTLVEETRASMRRPLRLEAVMFDCGNCTGIRQHALDEFGEHILTVRDDAFDWFGLGFCSAEDARAAEAKRVSRKEEMRDLA